MPARYPATDRLEAERRLRHNMPVRIYRRRLQTLPAKASRGTCRESGRVYQRRNASWSWQKSFRVRTVAQSSRLADGGIIAFSRDGICAKRHTRYFKLPAYEKYS